MYVHILSSDAVNLIGKKISWETEYSEAACKQMLVIFRDCSHFLFMYIFLVSHAKNFKNEKIICSTYHNFLNQLLQLEKNYLRNWLHKSATYFCKSWKYIIAFVKESNFSDGPTFFLQWSDMIKYDLWMEILKKNILFH